ncbi:hypothetical protein GBB52_04130 [Bifidobacterium longum]|nr:hypothetical protein GBB52_04130 [Bifidobacterium longum]
MWPDSGYEDWFLVEDAVFEHAVDHVAASAREADDSGVMALALFAFALVIGHGGRVFGGCDERGLPQRVLEAFVAPPGGPFAFDAGAGLAGGRSDARVGGQVGRAFEVGDVAADVPAYQDFMKQIVDQGIYIQWYDSATYPGGGVGYQDMFNGSNSPYVQDTDKGKISDSIFLNYWFSGNMLKDSAAHAESFGIDPKYAVFAGIESGQKKFDSIGSNAGYMNVNLDDTGKPYVSLAALGADLVSRELGDDKKVYPKYQNQVFDRERRLWTARPPARRAPPTSPTITSTTARAMTVGRASLPRSPNAPWLAVPCSLRRSTPVTVSNGVMAANGPATSSGATSTCRIFCRHGSGGSMPTPTRCRPTSTTVRTTRRYHASSTPRSVVTKAAIRWC